ncbi:MAG: hypothetical protein QW782_00385 [Candidatus Bathyarchaeia archaeon]
MESKRIFSRVAALFLLLGVILPIQPIVEATSNQMQENLFTVVGIIVRSSSGSPKIYPGSRRVNLRIETMYGGNETATRVYGHLKTVYGINFSAGSGPTAQARDPDGTIKSRVERGEYAIFNYYLDISKALTPNVYTLSLNITYVLERSDEIRWEIHYVPIKISEYPSLALSVIDAYLSPASYPGSVDTNLYVLIENSGESDIVSARFTVILPEGFRISNSRASVGTVYAGERFTITFTGISVPLDARIGAHSATIHVDASMRTDDGVNYNSLGAVAVGFLVSDVPKENPIVISSVSVLYRGSPAPLLPSARGVTVRVTLINRLPDPIGGISATIEPPNGIIVRGVSGTYANGMAPGGSCFIDITVDVSPDIKPGLVEFIVNLLYVKIVSDTSYMGEQRLRVNVAVETPHSYVPEMSLVSAYWGSPSPTPAYNGSRYVPLTLRFINNGRYDIIGGIVRAQSDLLRPIKASETLAPSLTPGSSSSVTLYFDIMAGGEALLKISVEYIFGEFGAHINVTRVFNIYLPIEEYPASSGSLALISSGWQSNYNVFPRTDNATYQVTIANRAPFPISGIILQLRLPENMSSQGNNVARAYFEGPVRSLGTFTTSFTISVGDVKPGKYLAKLSVDYMLLSGGPGVRSTEDFDIIISVNDDSRSVEFVSATWYEGSVGPNTYGAHLLVSIRNNYVDSMRGAILEVVFPRGFLNALDNSSLARVTPISAGLLSAAPRTPSDLGAQISEYLRALQVDQAQAFGKGDILTFVLNVHVLNVSIGIHEFEGIVSYIDQWGTVRSVKVAISAAVLGRTQYIGVYMSGSLNVRGRFTNTSLIVENFGTTPLYDVYLIVSPYQGMPILIASPAVRFLGKIDEYGRVEVPITLVYNPMGFISQVGGTTVMTYGPVPLMASIIYRDASGSLRRFNNTITVIVEPFIDLVVKDINTFGRNYSSVVSGVVANYGSATAYRVRATLSVGGINGSVLIGDIPPGDEMVFKVDVPVYGEKGTLIIEYYNIFNEQFSRELSVNIRLIYEAPAAPPASQGLAFEQWIVIGAVAAFLSFASFLIYRALRYKSLSKMSG